MHLLFLFVCMWTLVSRVRLRELVLFRLIINVCVCVCMSRKGDKEWGKDKTLGQRETDKKREGSPSLQRARLLAPAFCCGSNYMQPRAEGVPPLSDLEDSHRSTYSWSRTGIREQIQGTASPQVFIYGFYVATGRLVSQDKVVNSVVPGCSEMRSNSPMCLAHFPRGHY